MKLTPFLSRCGFTGVAECYAKGDPSEVKMASFQAVDVGLIRKTFGKAKLHDPKTGRFVFLVSRDKAIRVDTVNKRIVLANGKAVVQRLLQTLEEAK